MNKKYKELINYMLLNCDAIAFEIESFESVYDKIEESSILEQFNKYIKPYLKEKDNYRKKFKIYRNRVLVNEKKDRKSTIKALNSLNIIKENLLFKSLLFDFGAYHYDQQSRNLVLGYSINPLMYKYLLKYNNVLKYDSNKPSTIAFYFKGKCIYFINSLDRIIYSSCDDLLEIKIDNYKIVTNYSMNEVLYPYIKNNLNTEK